MEKIDKRRHLVVYISGPLNASTTDGWFTNIHYAREWCRILWQMGVTPICPHLNSLFMEGVVPYDDFLDGDLELIRRSDAVFMVGKFGSSKGAGLEMAYAKSIKTPVLMNITDLRAWVLQQEDG